MIKGVVCERFCLSGYKGGVKVKFLRLATGDGLAVRHPKDRII